MMLRQLPAIVQLGPYIYIFVLFQQSQANRDHEAAVKQNEFISKDLSGEERLQKALNEISDLTKKLCEQKTEFDDKVM